VRLEKPEQVGHSAVGERPQLRGQRGGVAAGPKGLELLTLELPELSHIAADGAAHLRLDFADLGESFRADLEGPTTASLSVTQSTRSIPAVT